MSVPKAKTFRKRSRKVSWMAATPQLNEDSEFCSLIPLCDNPDIRQQVVGIIRHALKVTQAPVWVQSESETVLFDYLMNCVEHFPDCVNLHRAVSGYRDQKQPGRAERHALFGQLGDLDNPIQLFSDGEDTSESQEDELAHNAEWPLPRQLLIDNTSQWFLDRLDEPYPPIGIWVADDAQIAQTWRTQAKSLKRSIHLLQPDRLQMTLHQHESARVCDPEGNLVAFVWRNFCPDESFLDSILKLTAEARNFILPVGDAIAIDFSSPDSGPVSAIVTFWELCCTWLPEEVISDIRSKSTYTDIILNKHQQRFPDGCLSKNHSRSPSSSCLELLTNSANYYSAIFRDGRLPTWKISWILKRTFNSHHGGSFYISDYGLRVEAISNTLIAWKPSEAHGVSLFNLDQCRQGLLQSGLTIGSLNGLLANLRASRSQTEPGEIP